MPNNKTQLLTGEFYHINLRAVGNDVVFKDTDDYFRGVFSVFEFNNANPVNIWLRRQQRKAEKIKESLLGLTSQYLEKRDRFIEVGAFCFMPNHVHLLVRQLKDNGISQFMQKVGGYAMYFNKKYNRKGHLFNNFKAVHIDSDEQLKNVLTYIHCNPISLMEAGFKERGIKDPKKVAEFLEQYKWSSYQDYIGIKNFPSVTDREFLLEISGDIKGCKEEVDNWISYKKELGQFYTLLE